MKYLYTLFLFFLCITLIAQTEEKEPLKLPLFESHDLVELSLTFDKASVLKDRGEVEEPSYHDAVVKYMENNQEVVLDAKVKGRGNMRLREFTCKFPPLRINFPKKKVVNTLFHGQDKLKIVTHCQLESYILKEYLVYRSYNQLTDYSFRVRLAKITYIDSEGTLPDETKYAFFIEDEEHVAERNGGKIIDEEERIKPTEANPSMILTTYLFQYMTGNKDYDFSLHRNMKVMAPADGAAPIPLPYDFDRASVVGAEYAKAKWKKKNESNRVFRHLCPTEEELKAGLEKYQIQKDAIFDLIANFSHLDAAGRKDMLKYFKDFYKLTKKSKVIAEDFMGNCK